MQRRHIDPQQPDALLLAEAASILREGGVVAYPTETYYGLAVDPRAPAAVGRLFAVKRRAEERPAPLIAADPEQVAALGSLPPEGARLAARFWPGPLTIVFRATARLAGPVVNAEGGVGVRVPANAVARGLARAFGFPVTATSANLSESPPTVDPAEVARQLGDALDLLLDAGMTPGGAPSTVVDLTEPSVRLVRPGAVAWERVLESLARPPDAS